MEGLGGGGSLVGASPYGRTRRGMIVTKKFENLHCKARHLD